jgi:uncharacterized membrane protein YedE/YeeE
MDLLRTPWPWYVVGPVIGLVVIALLVIGNHPFGVSSNLRHLCAIVAPRRTAFFRYDWWRTGQWNLAFAAGILLAGWIAGRWLAAPEPIRLSERTRADLEAMGVELTGGLVPREVGDLASLGTAGGLLLLIGGGLLIGFGTAYAGGCTSGHGVTGLACFERASLLAVIAFFAGGLLGTHLLLPRILALIR